MLSRKSLLIMINKFVEYITGYIGLFFIARFMIRPDYNYGIVSFALGFVGLFAFISNFFDLAHVKRISGKKEEGTCMGTYISLKSISILITVGLVFGGILFWKYGLGKGFQTPIHEKVVYIMLMFFALRNIGQIGFKTFVGKGMIAKSESIQFMDRTLPTIFIIYVALTGGEAIELALTYLLGGIFMVLLTIFYLKDIKIKKPTMKMVKSYWTFGWPSFFSSLAGKLGNKVDVVLIQLFWSSTNVGLYMAGRRLALIVNGIMMALSNVVFPTISSHHAELDWEKIQNVVKGAARYTSMFISPVIVFMILFPREMIHIMLSDDFLPAAPVVRILAINAFFMVYTTPFRNVFGGINKPKLGAKISVSGNLVNVALNILLIPDSLFSIPLFGLKEIGAAIATMTAGIIIAVSSIIISKREAGVKFPKNTILHIAAAVMSGVILYIWELEVLPISRFYHLFLYGLILLGIYAGILYLIGEFTREDWDYIWESIHPKEMWYYIRDELTGKHDDK